MPVVLSGSAVSERHRSVHAPKDLAVVAGYTLKTEELHHILMKTDRNAQCSGLPTIGDACSMLEPDTAIGFGNTLLPLVILAVVTAVLPYMLTPRGTRSHKRVAFAIGATAVTMVAVSGLVFAVLDTRELPDGGATGAVVIARFYMSSALGTVAVWGPVLALVWLGLAQRVERRRGEDMAQRDA